MRLKDFYKRIVEIGMKNDPRPKSQINDQLSLVKKEYGKLNPQDKALFDKERLTNPYDDTRVLNGKGDEEIKTVMVGIDIDTQELLLADRLNQTGKKIDLALSHHPRGPALAGFYEVMKMQSDILSRFGVPITMAEGLMEDRINEVKRSVSAANHMRAVDTARLLNMPFMCAHTVADNCVVNYLQNLMDKKKPARLGDALELLKGIPEYKESSKNNAPSHLLLGAPDRKAGKIFVDMTGGTEGSKEIFEKLHEAGVGTLICMHLSEQHYKKAKEAHINVIIAGHVSSDTIGLNLLFDQLEKSHKLNIIACSGYRRIKR
jgi:hypothetical protein